MSGFYRDFLFTNSTEIYEVNFDNFRHHTHRKLIFFRSTVRIRTVLISFVFRSARDYPFETRSTAFRKPMGYNPK